MCADQGRDLFCLREGLAVLLPLPLPPAVDALAGLRVDLPMVFCFEVVCALSNAARFLRSAVAIGAPYPHTSSPSSTARS